MADDAKAKAVAFAERMGQSTSSTEGGPEGDGAEEEMPEGLTKAQWAAQKRRTAREAARQTRLSKRPVVEEDEGPKAPTVGAWYDGGAYGGFPPFFGTSDGAERLYVETDDTEREARFAAADALAQAPRPAAAATSAYYVPFFDDDGTDAWVEKHDEDTLARYARCIAPRGQWGKHAPPWDAEAGRYVYAPPELYTTNHETVPELIENGDVELLRALLDCGHLPQGLDAPDPEFGLTAAYMAVTYDQPEILDELSRRGCDLRKPCDGEGDDAYGTPAFYAAYHGKVRVLETLVRLGVDTKDPCTKYGELPDAFYGNHGEDVARQLAYAATFRHRMASRLARYLWMAPVRKRYAVALKFARLIQRISRGAAGRRNAYALAMALLQDRNDAEAAVAAARAHLDALAAGDQEEEVLTMAEAVRREEEAEMKAALDAANDGREEWEEFFDDASGVPYYVHYQTGESVWEKPN